VIGAIAIGVDISEQKKRERELAVYRNQLRSLVSELTIAEDRERRNIASLLHDDVLQKLALSKMKLSMLRETLTSEDQLLALDNIHDYVSEMFRDMRSLTFDLCPPVLYDIGLEAAVRDWFQKELVDKHGIKVNLEARGQTSHLREDLRVALYRAIREVLMNVIKHARARKVDVTLAYLDDSVRVEVLDDGMGFDLAAVEAGNESSGGLGLFTVRERLEYFGGSLKAESTPGGGSRVTLTAALADREAPGRGE
jgi:signal transduction histidine kinase